MTTANAPGWPHVRFDFSGCRVLVTGGSSGIGNGIAAAFAHAGAEVIITGTRPKASDYASGLSAYTYHQLQMTDAAGIDAVAASIPALDVLVNNAGAALPGGQSEYLPDTFEQSLRINLTGAFRMAAACHEKLTASRLEGGASVINMASMASYFGIVMVPGYGAAKAGVVQMTKTLGAVWAKDGIRVNAIAPGHISSNMTAALEASAALSKPILQRTPMGRWGTPQDVAGVALFLASPAASFITGQTLPVDGGYSIA
jgi:NAD(P)-dependent dehydrogenase (short-subunit alcohol dehydrogenase family)